MSKDRGGVGIKLGLREPVVCSESVTPMGESEALGAKHIPASFRPTSTIFPGVYYIGEGVRPPVCVQSLSRHSHYHESFDLLH